MVTLEEREFHAAVKRLNKNVEILIPKLHELTDELKTLANNLKDETKRT